MLVGVQRRATIGSYRRHKRLSQQVASHPKGQKMSSIRRELKELQSAVEASPVWLLAGKPELRREGRIFGLLKV